MRIFFAHSSADPPAEIEKMAKQLKLFLLDRGAPKVTVTTGRKDYSRNFRGDWKGWAEGVVSRINATTRKPVYDMVIVPDRRCGRATAQLISAWIGADRPAVFWDKNNSLKKIYTVDLVDPDDWSTGHEIVLVGEEG